MIRTRAILVALVVATLLGGCAPGETEPTNPPVAEPPVETPESEPTKPPLIDLELRADGLGPLVIGEAPPATDPEVDVLVFDEEFCAEYVADGSATEPGLWVANYPAEDPDFPRLPFNARVEDGVLEALIINDPAIQTEGGVGLGSSLEQLLAESPDAVRIAKDYIDLYVITATTGQLVFEVGTADSIGYDPDVIALVHVIPADMEPYSFANSDVGFGNCVSA